MPWAIRQHSSTLTEMARAVCGLNLTILSRIYEHLSDGRDTVNTSDIENYDRAYFALNRR